MYLLPFWVAKRMGREAPVLQVHFSKYRRHCIASLRQQSLQFESLSSQGFVLIIPLAFTYLHQICFLLLLLQEDYISPSRSSK